MDALNSNSSSSSTQPSSPSCNLLNPQSETNPTDEESLNLTPDEQCAYDQAITALTTPPTEFCGPLPTLVTLENTSHEVLQTESILAASTPPGALPSTPSSTSTSSAVFHNALGLLSHYEKKEAALPPLPALVDLLGPNSLQAVPQDRRVCQHPFRKNDIVWVCRTCQADETCVLCHECFSQSQHEGHDVAFYHAQAGGCCDCGDPEAWDPAGFCPRHGPNAMSSQEEAVPPELIHRVRGVIPACIDWLVKGVAATAETAYSRAQQSTPHVFDPQAASGIQQQQSNNDAAAQELGLAGQEGLYIVLHADEIHPVPVVVDALKEFWGGYLADNPVTSTVKLLRQYGQLVIFGVAELVVECGWNQVQLWRQGDHVACGRIGATILSKASILQKHGLFCSILTRQELMVEQRAVTVLQWVSTVARSCDPLCRTVAETIVPNRHLAPLLRSDFKMSARVTKAWYSLLLTLLAVPTFKSHLAAAYCDTYQAVTAKYARGMGVLERSGYTLSVQFLNRVTYVIDLVEKRDLLGKLGKSLLETLQVACSDGGRLDPNHFVLTFRRYSPCVSDLKCVLNVSGMPRVIAAEQGTFLTDWIAALRLTQFMDTQVWRLETHGHVAEEARGWVGAFNSSISLGSLFERLLGWYDDEHSPIMTGPLAGKLMNCADLAFLILRQGVGSWQQADRVSYQQTRYTPTLVSHGRASGSLAFSTVAASHGTAMAMTQLPVAQLSPFSFHLPLHRFAAGCLRELCLRGAGQDGMEALTDQMARKLTPRQYDDLFQGLMEYPILVLTRAAQVRAGLWRRNGPGLNDQVLNYAEPPFCRNMRDADLLLAQYATLGRVRNQSAATTTTHEVGMAFLVHLALHRFGLFHFTGLIAAPSANPAQYMKEVAANLYPAELCALEVEDDDVTLPWTYTPSESTATSMLLLEEFLHFMIMFVSELPPEVPLNKQEQTDQAKARLFREVVHRLASGPKTHSELSEVHHVLSHWDNLLLSEEGKTVNPDDATGAALGSVLDKVASRKVSRGKMEPDKWELNLASWEAYDPAFFHCSLRSHQTAAEARPKPRADSDAAFGWEARPYAPAFNKAHPSFSRLRRDATADAATLAVMYRVLHLHCRSSTERNFTGLQGNGVYDKREKSETALARALHFITLGAFAWTENMSDSSDDWTCHGGGSAGSLFYNYPTAPDANTWIKEFLLADPGVLTGCEWYAGEECALVLLRRLAVTGGTEGLFVAHDIAVRSGAAWLSELALERCADAAKAISPVKKAVQDDALAEKKESEIERRKKMAKEKAMARMQAQAAKFALMMDVDLGSEEEESVNVSNPDSASAPGTPHTNPARKYSFGSNLSSGGSSFLGDEEANFSVENIEIENSVPSRLLRDRPRCIICNGDDECRPVDNVEEEGENSRRKSRRRTENALGMVGFVQPSLVMKGGGGLPTNMQSPMSTVHEFVGTYIALCGHAVHSECCESYLASVSNREDRYIGKRDEFKCPLCQRLSNCLVPFIDVGVDWIDASESIGSRAKTEDESMCDTSPRSRKSVSFHEFLDSTPWWVSRKVTSLHWDGQSLFVERAEPQVEGDLTATKPSRIRSLRKKDLYAAWNSVMRTPRLVRKRLRRQGSRSSNTEKEVLSPSIRSLPLMEESVGETVVWRRLMDQISDIGYRADSKRLGDENLHDLFGEFRHYIVEKYAYNNTGSSRVAGRELTDWPSCLFRRTISEDCRQEMSREKLLSKLLYSIQAFVYTTCCESFEARRGFRKNSSSVPHFAAKQQDSGLEALLSRFGISDVVCDSRVVVLPVASASVEGGATVFDGRIGRLRYLALAAMAAAGAIAPDLIQLVLPFPSPAQPKDPNAMDLDCPDRAPIAYPILLGHVLTHITAALCAACGRARARSDSLDVLLPVSLLPKGHCTLSDEKWGEFNSVVGDCEGFIMLGVLARMTQVLFGALKVAPSMGRSGLFSKIESSFQASVDRPPRQLSWMRACMKLLDMCVPEQSSLEDPVPDAAEEGDFESACALAAFEVCSFLDEAAVVAQVVVPSFSIRFHVAREQAEGSPTNVYDALESVTRCLGLEPVSVMLESSLVREIVAYWVNAAFGQIRASFGPDDEIAALRRRLYRTQGFRVYDWPSTGTTDEFMQTAKSSAKVLTTKSEGFMHDSNHEVERIPHALSHVDVVRSTPTLLTCRSPKSVPLLGGTKLLKDGSRPHVTAIPPSYTDLYAELGQLLPDCDQTAVCLVCGEVLNAGGRGECTRHSYKCGAGAGMFFLLQECTGLIMHKNKAAYIHSPYVDSHGETPQYRGRPLNLDLERYEHLREVWFSHGVRQRVVAERTATRQMIVPDFY